MSEKPQFTPKKTRKLFLSAAQTARLGGPTAVEVMRLQLDEKLTPDEIRVKLQLTELEYQTIVLTHYYKRTLKQQQRLRENDEKFRALGTIDPQKTNLLHGGVKVEDQVPAKVTEVKLPKGVSPTQYVLDRLQRVSPAAVEKLVWLMQHSHNETVQYNAAIKILGLNGIVEIEKSITAVVAAEDIIRELNKGTPPPRTVEITDAEVIDGEYEGAGRTGESGPEGSQPGEGHSGEHEALARGPVGDDQGRGDMDPGPGGPEPASEAIPGEPVATPDSPRVAVEQSDSNPKIPAHDDLLVDDLPTPVVSRMAPRSGSLHGVGVGA